ncbi:mycothione reductase [Pseudonocardia benzenivorans]|uniref:Mycothione reductase n=2 Tax=Pseudonocardia TaxID=1847 RepID=F4D153_PSEUX|nr:mycothione reductase [Pseudonocardia dioxanivorans]AEA26841.1 mycothione reductase [Pseudonocardia dioxanivorans CB1190]GJF03709.1 mycothione reductase [Pseudonocardia sp. D17]
MRHHDLVVIGSGSGNSIVDDRFADLDVAIIEHGTFGGTCLNVGCIPTKMYVYAADVAEAVRRAPRYGVDATLDGVRWADIRDRVFGRIDPIAQGGKEYRLDPVRTPNVTTYLGHARFTGDRTLSITPVDGGPAQTVTADRIVVAAGGRPHVPDPIRDSGVPYETSDTVMRLEKLPERVVILGGGYIAAEFAHVFSAFGVGVTLVARGERLLRFSDDTVGHAFTTIAQERWDVRLGTVADGARLLDGGGVELTLTDGSTASGDLLLVATGRVPNSDLLDVAAGGIATHPDGRVVVDETQATTAPGVWALGDVSSPFQLKHVANHEVRVVQHNLLHPDAPRRSDHRFVPSAVFTEPQLAGVGLTERQAREQGLDVVTKVQAFGDVAYGWAMEDTTGLCKIVAERTTGRILGAHLMGPQASTLIQPLIQAMTFGLDARTMAVGQYWIHPALPEVVENALLGLPLELDEA